VDSVLVSGFPIWVLSLLTFLFLGIPAFFLLILGLKLIIPNMKSIGNVFKYTLLGVWFLTVIIASVFGFKQGAEFFHESKEVKKENILVNVSDTLVIKMKSNPIYENDLNYNSRDYKIIKDESNKEVLYLNDIAVRFKFTDDKNVSIQIEKKAKGNSLDSAKERAKAIQYKYMINQNTIYLNDYMTTELKNRYRNQEIEIIIYLPEGTILKTDNRFDNFFENQYYDLEYFENIDGAIHKVENQKLKCLNCKTLEGYENTETTIESDTIGYGITIEKETNINEKGTKVVINKDGIVVEEENKAPEKKEFKGLKINKEGIIIKTE
ncbi:MAG: hypothetical protein ACOVQ2_10475, partial [Flavobacterium sp.]